MITLIFLSIIGFLSLRFIQKLISVFSQRKINLDQTTEDRKKINMIIVFGSGGHTTELLMLFKDYDFITRCQNLYFIRAETDKSSENRVKIFFEERKVKINNSQISWIVIPRSREVKQSYISSIFTTIKSILSTFFRILNLKRVEYLITNGPGTCIPVVLSVIIQWMIFLRPNVKIIFIESWCRVFKFSLTGYLLYPIADRFIVHWPQLKKYKRCEYLGQLI